MISEGFSLRPPALVVHGGAGQMPAFPEKAASGVLAALAEGSKVLQGGGTAVDAAVAAVASLEGNGGFNAGLGAVPTSDGSIELDACVMDGVSGRAGAVGAAKWPARPIEAALAVLRLGEPGATLLVGAGADRFAAESGLRPRGSEVVFASWQRAGEEAGQDPEEPPTPPVEGEGTVGAIALDKTGALAAATSTGGRSGQRPGRVGDSAVAGAGTLASSSLAVSATGYGEVFVAVGFGFRVEWALRSGSTLLQAAADTLREVEARGGQGGAILLSASGEAAAVFDTAAMARGWRDARGWSVQVGPGEGTGGFGLAGDQPM